MSIFTTIAGIDLTELTAEIIRQNRAERADARAEKKEYLQKLEQASGEDVFKLMNLISFASMDEFIAEARLHAQQSFRICMISASVGFLIICVSVGFGIYFQLAGIEGLSAAYLGSVVGLITEAISAIFFSLYSRTTNQVNRLYDRLLASQSAFSSILGTTLLEDQKVRAEHIAQLSSRLMDRSENLEKRSG
ncbi:MAG: TRADD-N-associated membrane domain-containing protein [Cognatishimia sp.]